MGREGRKAKEKGSSSVAGGCDGGCKVACSHVAGAEVESIRSTGAQSRPVSFWVSWASNTEKHLRRAARDSIWLADGSGRGGAISEVLTMEYKTLTRPGFSKVQLGKTKLQAEFAGLSPRGRRLQKTPTLQNTDTY